MPDQPIAHTKDGRPLFDNTPTVVCVLLHHLQGLVVIQRANDPGRGLLALPGGYHMRGETWQDAGAREVLEETGYTIDPEHLRVSSIETDEYGNNLLIARYTKTIFTAPDTDMVDGETEKVLHLKAPTDPKLWAFPRHWAAAQDEFRGFQ